MKFPIIDHYCCILQLSLIDSSYFLFAECCHRSHFFLKEKKNISKNTKWCHTKYLMFVSCTSLGWTGTRLQVLELSGLLTISSWQLTIYIGSYFACCHCWEAEDLGLHAASGGFLLNWDIYAIVVIFSMPLFPVHKKFLSPLAIPDLKNNTAWFLKVNLVLKCLLWHPSDAKACLTHMFGSR